MKMNVRVEDIFNYDTIKANLTVRICNEKNINPDLVYNEVLNLCETYHILLDEGDDGIKSIPVTHQLVKLWASKGYNVSNLRGDTMESAKKIAPATFRTMGEVLGLFGVDSESESYILSTESMTYGAAAMVYPGLLSDICKKLNTNDLVIIPSSIHEVIILPFCEEIITKDFDKMICDINNLVVLPEDVLDNRAYYYNKAVDKICYLSDFLRVFNN